MLKIGLPGIIFFLMSTDNYVFASSVKETATCPMKINVCHVEKSTYKNGWKSVYKKELRITDPCFVSGWTGLQVEPELGLRIDTLTQNDRKELIIALYSYKATFTVASSTVPIESEYINFSHRLKPKGKEIVEVTCKSDIATNSK